MTRNILLLAMFSLGTVGFTACGGDDDDTTATDADTDNDTTAGDTDDTDS